MTDPEAQLAGFFAKYEPAMVEAGTRLRAKLRARLPGFFEIVYFYENQKALVISYSPTEHGYEGLCSMAVYPDQMKLHFAQGVRLSDPQKLLQGRGTARHALLQTAEDFERPEVEGWMVESLNLANLQPDPGRAVAVIIKADSQAQRRAARKAGGSAKTGS